MLVMVQTVLLVEKGHNTWLLSRGPRAERLAGGGSQGVGSPPIPSALHSSARTKFTGLDSSSGERVLQRAELCFPHLLGGCRVLGSCGWLAADCVFLCVLVK